MRFLRMLTNAVLAGGLGAAYLSVLCLQLNPSVRLTVGNLTALVSTLAMAYGVHLAVAFYVAIVLRQIVAAEPLSPGWISLRVLSWLLVADAGGAATLMWLNLRTYAPVLGLETSQRMATGAAVVTACALVSLGVALAHYTFGRRRGRVGASFVSLALVASLVGPVLARGPGRRPPSDTPRPEVGASVGRTPPNGRVIMLAFDGASLEFLSTAALGGRLPSLGRILDRGAAMHLATVRPTQPDPVWTAVATGKRPMRTGVRSAATYYIPSASDPLELLPDWCFAHGLVSFGFLSAVPHTSASIRAQTLWSILGSRGFSSGVVNWPLTYPAQPVRGYLVTDRFYRGSLPLLEPDDRTAVFPPSLFETARELVSVSLPEVDTAVEAAGRYAADDPRRDVLTAPPFVTDRLYEQLADALESRLRPDFSVVRYQELDLAGHRFLRYARPDEFGDVSVEERRRFGQALEDTYARIDAVVGRAMSSLGPDDLLLVVSGFGMHPLAVGKRALERMLGSPDWSGSHENAPDGFLLAFGPAVIPGRKDRGSVLDLVPTVLYYLGLPVARDMDGLARTDVFTRDFTDQRPLAFIPTYEPASFRD